MASAAGQRGICKLRGKVCFWDFSSQLLFHGLDLFFAQRRQELSFRSVVSDAMSCDHEGQGHVQVPMDDRLASGQSRGS